MSNPEPSDWGTSSTALLPTDKGLLPTGPRRYRFGKEIAWRFTCALVFTILIGVVLRLFEGKGSLNSWEKRGFNALTILFSSLVSLSVGSLLGLLGSMIRWRLLAWKKNTPMDADLILGMANPTGSLRLIDHHARDRKWTRTTSVVALYLIVNIVGRLGVASLGLAYSLNENAELESPIMVSDWSSDGWVSKAARAGNGPLSLDLDHVSLFSVIGLLSVQTEFQMTDESSYNLTNITGQGLDRKVEGNALTYSYSLREYSGSEVRASADRILRSSSRCVGRVLYNNGDVYERGAKVGNIPLDPTARSFCLF
ncbi:hypothetical protein DL770_011022 [Monosporascus sp. CRB-9-2]|nr:hypothetical protein DL770_011022 [Monosporascus sp. CRB-9-2]